MPTTSDYLFQFHATPEYRAFLDRLRIKSRLSARAGDYLAIVEEILGGWGEAVGIDVPPRTKGVGGKRAGAGRKKAID